jgi:predicted nucleic acid-binding protein
VTVLLDGTVLSNFAALGRLDLLAQSFEEAFIVTAVLEEVARGIQQGYGFLTAIEQQIESSNADGWLRMARVEADEEQVLLEGMPPKLGAGEAMSLAIAKVRGWTVFTDDAAARAVARQLGIAVGGTLGVLRRLIEFQVLTVDEANRLLARMIDEAGYRSPITDLGPLLSP